MSCPMRRAAFRLIWSILLCKRREIQNEWWTNISKKTQQYAHLGDYRGFYKALKAVYGPIHRVQSLVRSADGQVIFTHKAFILSRWSEHFQSLFSADCVVQDPAVLRIPRQPFKEEMDEIPAMKEITKAIEHLRSGKRKIRLLQLLGDHTALHRRKNRCLCAPKQKPSVGSEPTEAPQTWCSSSDSSKRNGESRTNECM